jgi:AcrR family transcriptional regulator
MAKSDASLVATPGSGGKLSTRLGRPRANPNGRDGADPREEILTASARLFTSVGYAQASTKRIAEAVGLRQASLFYYFPRKEDILGELLDRTVQRSLDFVDRLGKGDAPPDIGLYLLIYNDLQTLCSPPGQLGWLVLQPDARSERFADFWKKHARLFDAYLSLVRAGQGEGLFNVDDPEMTARILSGLVEGVVSWSGPPIQNPGERVWEAVTEFALRGILADAEQIPTLRKRAKATQERLDVES